MCHPQLKYMFHIFIILPPRIYYELPIWPAPSWLDISRVLHWHGGSHGFESLSSLIFFFRFSFRNFLTFGGKGRLLEPILCSFCTTTKFFKNSFLAPIDSSLNPRQEFELPPHPPIRFKPPKLRRLIWAWPKFFFDP